MKKIKSTKTDNIRLLYFFGHIYDLDNDIVIDNK